MNNIETAIQLYSYCTTLPLQTNMSLWGAIASAPAAQAAASEPESTSAAFFLLKNLWIQTNRIGISSALKHSDLRITTPLKTNSSPMKIAGWFRWFISFENP